MNVLEIISRGLTNHNTDISSLKKNVSNFLRITRFFLYNYSLFYIYNIKIYNVIITNETIDI